MAFNYLVCVLLSFSFLIVASSPAENANGRRFSLSDPKAEEHQDGNRNIEPSALSMAAKLMECRNLLQGANILTITGRPVFDTRKEEKPPNSEEKNNGNGQKQEANDKSEEDQQQNDNKKTNGGRKY